MNQSYVYILKCFDNSYYTGVTSNLTQRVFQHEVGFILIVILQIKDQFN